MAAEMVRIACSIAFLTTSYAGVPCRAADRSNWVAGDLNVARPVPEIALLPMHGPVLVVRLPEELRDTKIGVFGAEGKAVYGLTDRGILKVEFNPLRKGIVPGTSGVLSIWSLTVLRGSGHIFVSGEVGNTGCGTYEINPKAGTMQAVLAGPLPDCGGGGGVVSPDGHRIVKYRDGGLDVKELRGGEVRRIDGFAKNKPEHGMAEFPAMDFSEFNWMWRAGWSPDGRWISMVDKKSGIVVIDADNFDRWKHLGRTTAYEAVWSPDSKYLLVAGDDPLLTWGSSKAVNVNTSKWIKIRNPHLYTARHRRIGMFDASVTEAATPLEESRHR